MDDLTLDSADRFRRAIGDLVRAVQQVEDAPAGQIETLGFLVRDGAQSIAELARRRRIRHQSMSGAIADFESRGLVTRTPDPADGRGVLIELTARGSAMVEESRASRSSMILRVAEHALSAEEIDALTRVAAILDKLRDGILAEAAADESA